MIIKRIAITTPPFLTVLNNATFKKISSIEIYP
jgi:hypothetical protein